jgi:hypothetical protein
MTIAEASKVFGVNTAYIKLARVVLQSGDDDLITKVKNGQLQLTTAAEEVQDGRPRKERAQKATHHSKKRAPAPNTCKRHTILLKRPFDGLPELLRMILTGDLDKMSAEEWERVEHTAPRIQAFFNRYVEHFDISFIPHE